MLERDAMVCRACGNEERASEGYPCAECGTFICLICNFRGVTLCRKCQAAADEARAAEGTPPGSTPPESASPSAGDAA